MCEKSVLPTQFGFILKQKTTQGSHEKIEKMKTFRVV